MQILGFRISKQKVPNWFAKLFAKATNDPHFDAVKYRLGPKLHFDNAKVTKINK